MVTADILPEALSRYFVAAHRTEVVVFVRLAAAFAYTVMEHHMPVVVAAPDLATEAVACRMVVGRVNLDP